MNWYLAVLKKYAVFTGRARRKEYWMFILFYTIFGLVVGIIDNVAGLRLGPTPYGIISTIYSLAMFLPALAVLVRRLHDIGKSGWWMLISLIPLAGAIWLLVLVCLQGNSGTNKYGQDPKQSFN